MATILAAQAGMAMFAGIAQLAVGLFVLRAAPARPVNRAFAAFAFVAGPVAFFEGLRKWLADDAATLYSRTDPAIAAATAVFLTLIPVWAILWLRLAGVAVGGPLAWIGRPAGSRSALVTAIALLPVSAAIVVADTTFSEVYGAMVSTFLFLVSITVIVTAAIARHRARGADARRRATAYLSAFIVHDVAWMVFLGFNVFAARTGEGALREDLSTPFYGTLTVTYSLVAFVFLPLVLYAMFKGRLLGIEDRFRRTLSASAAVGAVAAVFLVAVELIESFVDVRGAAVSVAVAAGLAIAFRPLHALTERATLRVIPRKPISSREYEVALRKALQDGTISPAEQRVLDALRARQRDASG